MVLSEGNYSLGARAEHTRWRTLEAQVRSALARAEQTSGLSGLEADEGHPGWAVVAASGRSHAEGSTAIGVHDEDVWLAVALGGEGDNALLSVATATEGAGVVVEVGAATTEDAEEEELFNR